MRLSLSSSALFAILFASIPAFAEMPSVAPPSVVAPRIPSGPALRTDAPAKPSYTMPKQQTPQMRVQSWETHVETTVQYHPPAVQRLDPYKAEITGVQRGTELHATVQAPSEKVQLPSSMRIPARSAAVRKELNRDFNKQLAANVGKAVQETPLFDTTADVDSPKQTVTLESPAHLGTHAPLTLQGRDMYNRPLTPVRVTTEGLQETMNGSSWRDGNRTVTQKTTTGGTLVEPYKPWAKMENVYTTPAFEKDGKPVIKVLGLAAFPRNATVKFTNTRMRGEGDPGATVQLEKMSNAGAGDQIVPAMQGDRIEIEVSYPEIPGKARAASQTYTFDVPLSSKVKGTEPFRRTNTGIGYYPVVKPEPAAPPPATGTAN
jgi:hypothetical protein